MSETGADLCHSGRAMSLQGSFEVLGFADVVNLLAHKRESGRLRIRGPGIATDFFFDGGRLTAADDGEAQPPSSEKEARTRVEEAFFEILAHERGTFEFQTGTTTPWTAGLAASVERVLAEANRRLEEWREIETVIPNMDLRPRVVQELAGESVTIDADSWRLLVSIDGRRNLHALARKLGLSRFEARRLLRGLIESGLAEIDTDQPRASIPHEPDTEVGAGAGPGRARAGVRFPRKRADGDGDGEAAENGNGKAEAATVDDAGDESDSAETTEAADSADATTGLPPRKRGLVKIESRRKRPPAPS